MSRQHHDPGHKKRTARDLTNPRTTLALLDDDEKGLQSVQTLGGQGRPHGREDR